MYERACNPSLNHYPVVQMRKIRKTSDARKLPSVCFSLSLPRGERTIVPARRMLEAALGASALWGPANATRKFSDLQSINCSPVAYFALHHLPRFVSENPCKLSKGPASACCGVHLQRRSRPTRAS
jgi:hypothetical protein